MHLKGRYDQLNESWSVAAEGRAFARVPASDPLHGLRRDGYLSLRLTRWFRLTAAVIIPIF